MIAPPFVHLHCHSHYSLLDGASSIDRLIERTKLLGMNALALTDHGNLYGALEFYQKAKAAGIKPIIGYEAYVAPGSRFHKEAASMKEASSHLTLLAQNATGYRNLLKLATAAFLEGFYFRPRIDKQLLADHNEGLICLSGCASSELNRTLLAGSEPDIEKAVRLTEWYRGVFGDRYYIEIQDNGTEIQRAAMQGAVEVARRTGIPLVVTSDVHYVNPEDADAQDILICVNTGKFRADAKRMRMGSKEYYLRSPQQMYEVFAGHEDALRRSQEIADRVELELEIGQRHFPIFVPPQGTTSEQFLRQLCLEGLRERYRNDPQRCRDGQLCQEVMDRLDRELDVINKLGFANYFLIVWDFVRFAREQGIPATARGSGVGSLVAYGLYLSHVCPLKYDLLFERFLDENRREAPDIDIDFCQQRRGEVIQYVKEKYGTENVAQIGTFGTLAARAAIRDVGRALGLPLPRVNAVVSLVPEQMKITIEKALQISEDLKKVYDSDPEVRELLDLARQVEGLARNVGTHAAAVVIADRPLIEYLPLQRGTGKEEIITQWAMADVERAGLLKMDFLGLRNLTILSKTVDLIEQTTGQRIDPYCFPLDDPKTFALLCHGETKGVFQLESGGIRDLLQRMKPDHFRDIIATNALYRPGPLEGGMVDDYIQVKHGRKKAEYKHPVMKEILEETHGVMVYQEQVMRILNRLGGIKLANAYTCIKAISKKKLAIIAKFREEFIEGAQAQGLSKKDAEELFGLIEKFAGYGFNKSHSTAYALIAYITAYLKAHWPVEFMAALLSSDMPARNFTRKDSLVEHIEDCHRMGIEVVPPDVNSSGADFTVSGGRILFGLGAIKGCGVGAAEAIVAERQAHGPFRGLFDFCERLESGVVNRTAIESLVKAGAFDSLASNRAQLFQGIDRALQAGAAAAADRRCGQLALFGDEEEPAQTSAVAGLPDVPEWEHRDKLAKEKEVLGFYRSSHPLAEHQATLAAFCSHSTTQAAKLAHRAEVTLGGMISSIKLAHTKNPRPGSPTRYAMFDLEDAEGVIRCILWPEPFQHFGDLVQPDAILAVVGVIDKRGGDEANLIVNELIPLEELASRRTKSVVLRVHEEAHGVAGLERLYEILRAYPGSCDVELVVMLADGAQVKCRCQRPRIEPSLELRTRVAELLGPENVRFVAASRANGNGGRKYGKANGRFANGQNGRSNGQ